MRVISPLRTDRTGSTPATPALLRSDRLPPSEHLFPCRFNIHDLSPSFGELTVANAFVSPRDELQFVLMRGVYLP
jgi:hypothetical protein